METKKEIAKDTANRQLHILSDTRVTLAKQPDQWQVSNTKATSNHVVALYKHETAVVTDKSTHTHTLLARPGHPLAEIPEAEAGRRATVLVVVAPTTVVVAGSAPAYGVTPSFTVSALSVNSDVPARLCVSHLAQAQVPSWGRLGEVGEVGLVLPACLCSVRPGGREITAPARSQLE